MSNKEQEIAIHKKNTNGFTLIEIAVVLTIASTLIVSVLSIGSTYIDSQKSKDTNQRMDFIIKTIDQYVKIYGRLPCPANGALSNTDTNFGLEEISSGTCQNGGSTNITKSGNIFIGVLPFKTLELAHPIAIDGWNSKITYAVDGRLATESGYSTVINAPDINILDSSGTNLLVDPNEKAAVVIVSHGENKFGAWRGSSRFSPTGGSAVEDENADLDADFQLVYPNLTNDDALRYKSRWQMGE